MYFNSLTDRSNFIHSIDMIYIDYWLACSEKTFTDRIRSLHDRFPDVRFDENLECSYHQKYDYFHGYQFFGGVDIKVGKYQDYDKDTKKFTLLPCCRIRLNPNKIMYLPWAREFWNIVFDCTTDGVIIKWDYAVDIAQPLDDVQVFRSRKEKGLYKGTRYFGQSGKNGYCKIYDKKKEIETKQHGEVAEQALTRVEHTFKAGEAISLEEVYVLSKNTLKTDLSALCDTDRAIVEMYLRLKAMGVEYDLKLGRRKLEKIKEYVSGQYALLDYGDYMQSLLKNACSIYHCSILSKEDIERLREKKIKDLSLLMQDHFEEVPKDMTFPWE